MQSVARAVCQRKITARSGGELRRSKSSVGDLWSLASTVGHNENALSFMVCTDFLRCKQACRNDKPHSLKVSDDVSEGTMQMGPNVLSEEPACRGVGQ
jgi:hypothetical protein